MHSIQSTALKMGFMLPLMGSLVANPAAALQSPMTYEEEEASIIEKIKVPYISFNDKGTYFGVKIKGSVPGEWTNSIKLVDKNKQVPLVIVLHGNGSNANVALVSNGFNQKKVNVIGLNAGTNSSGTCYPDFQYPAAKQKCKSWQLNMSQAETVGDTLLKFIELTKQFPFVNRKKIYVFGESGGGVVTLRNICKLAGKVAAFGVSAALPRDIDIPRKDANIPINSNKTVCKNLTVDIPYIHVHGNADGAVNYNGISQNDANKAGLSNHAHMSAPMAIEEMKKYNGATLASSPFNINTNATDQSSVELISYRREVSGAPLVKMVRVDNGGHLLAGSMPGFPLTQDRISAFAAGILGNFNRDIVGAIMVLDFFLLHELKTVK